MNADILTRRSDRAIKGLAGLLTTGLVLLLSLSSPLSAQPTRTPRLAATKSEYVLINLLELEDNNTASRIRLSQQLERHFVAEPPPSGLVDALRWAPSSAQALTCLEPVRDAERALEATPSDPRPADAADILLKSLLHEADGLLLDLKLDATRRHLKLAQALIPCLSQPIETSQVRALFLYDAVARFYQKDPQYAAYFQYMLAADPRLFLETDYPPKVQQAFLTVAKKASRLPPVPLDLAGLEGQLFINGRPAAAQQVLAPGRHLLQQQGPLGELVSTFISVPETPAGRVPPPFLLAEAVPALPRAIPVLEDLREQLQRAELRPESAEALRRFAEKAGDSLLGFAVKTEDGKVAARFFRPGQGLVEPKDDELRALERTLDPAENTQGASSGRSAGTSSRPDADPFRAPDAGMEPQHSEAPALRTPGLQVSLGSGVQLWLSSSAVQVVNARQFPLSLRASWQGETWRGVLELGMGLVGSPAAVADECGSYVGENPPTDAELAAALACTEGGRMWELGAGLARPLPLGHRLTLTPTVSLHARVLPQVLVRAGDASSWTVHQALSVGPTLSSRLSWHFPGSPSRSQPAFGFFVEPAAGLQVAGLEQTLFLSVPVSIMVGGEVFF